MSKKDWFECELEAVFGRWTHNESARVSVVNKRHDYMRSFSAKSYPSAIQQTDRKLLYANVEPYFSIHSSCKIVPGDEKTLLMLPNRKLSLGGLFR